MALALAICICAELDTTTKAKLFPSNCFSHSLAVSFAQWHYRSQWGSSEARLLLIENFSQYPARRLEIQSALQFLPVHTWTLLKPKYRKHSFSLCYLLFKIKTLLSWVKVLLPRPQSRGPDGRTERTQRSPYMKLTTKGWYSPGRSQAWLLRDFLRTRVCSEKI